MTVEGKRFQKLLRVLEPRFKVPSRYTMMKDCVKLYMRDKNILKNTFFMTGVHEGLKNVEESIIKIRNIANYGKSSP